jgi:hypothetical protein
MKKENNMENFLIFILLWVIVSILAAIIIGKVSKLGERTKCLK